MTHSPASNLPQPYPILTEAEVMQQVQAGLAGLDTAGKRLLVVIPDATRTSPMPALIRALYRAVGRDARAFDVMIALGTHQPMSDAAIDRHLGLGAADRAAWTNFRVMNHDWYVPGTLIQIGTVPAAEAAAITRGIIAGDVPVIVNRQVMEHDHILICGPVFPHESVGFSGGNKYLFPGIAGIETISTFHWLAAMLTTTQVIGYQDTPVRALIDRYAACIPTPVTCVATVVSEAGVHGVFTGDAVTAQAQAAALSARIHVIYRDKPVHTVIAEIAGRYDELWTGSKGMYKTEPVVSDGGRIILYAPHIDEVSYTHGQWLDRIGYHVRDYFAAQLDRFADVPRVVMGHSTSVKGTGAYDPHTGVETARIAVDLAMRIPPERCRKINLGYVDPASISLGDWERRALDDDGILVVRHAGEQLYRLRA